MFTSLHVAKKSGAIAFDWSTANIHQNLVIVSGIDWNDDPIIYGLCIADVMTDYTETEYALSVAFAVVAEPAPWSPEQL